MERSHHHSDNNTQHQQDSHVLRNFPSIVMQSNSSHQSNNVQAHPQTHAESQSSRVQSHNQPSLARLSSTTSGRATLTHPPRTYDPSALTYNLPQHHYTRNEGMELMTTPWGGRSAQMPYMEDAYTHATATTQLTAMGTHLQVPLGILSAETYHPGASDRLPPSRPREQTRSQQSASSAAVGGFEDQAMQSWGLMRVNESETSSSANTRPQKRKPPEGEKEGVGRRKKKQKQKVETLSDDDEEKKSRGRPRLDPKDETAADRRRTQIRMAQRAYRHRKETTISTLEAQVQDLKGTNEEMSNIFINLYDMAVKNGLLQREPDFGQHLKSATEKFYALAQSATVDADQNDNDSTALPSSRNPSLVDDHAFSNQPEVSQPLDQLKEVVSQPVSTNNNVWGGYQISEEHDVGSENLDYGSMSFGAPPHTQEQQSDNIMVTARATVDNASSSRFLPHTKEQQANNLTVITRATEENASFPFDAWPNLQSFNADVPSMEEYSAFLPSQTLPLPNTLAYSEATFSRRLQRTTLENGIKLVTMPNPPPKRYNEVFGFCRRHETKLDIELRLRSCLERTAKESIHSWHSPFVHLGGAGTHYPVDSIEMASAEMPKFRTGLSMGPFNSSVADLRNQYVTHDLHIKLPGFEGSFFDANDVDGYLRGKGIEILPNSEFVEVDLDVLHEYDDYTSTSNASDDSPRMPRTPSQSHYHSITDRDNPNPSGYFDAVVSSRPIDSLSFSNSLSQSLSESDVEAEKSTLARIDPVTMTAFQFRDDFDWSFDQRDVQNFRNSGSGHMSPHRKRVVKLDVMSLIKAIVHCAVCLGRAPGFRPADVDCAIRASIRDAKAREI